MEEDEKVEGVTPTTDAAASRLVLPWAFCVHRLKRLAVQFKYMKSLVCQLHAKRPKIPYRKSSIKPPGGLFDFRHSRGGLIREGSLLEWGAYSKS